MKKFKTSAEKRQLHEEGLNQILAEKNLVRTALLNYTHVPLGLIVAALMLLSSWLGARQPLSMENALFVYLGIGSVAFFYMLQSYQAFARHRAQLSHVRNAFVGNPWLPMLFGMLMMFIAASLGLPVFSLTGILLLLALCYHLPLLGIAFGQHGLLNRLFPPLFLAALMWIPMLSPNGALAPNPIGLSLISCVVFCGLAWRAPKTLMLASEQK